MKPEISRRVAAAMMRMTDVDSEIRLKLARAAAKAARFTDLPRDLRILVAKYEE